MGATQDDSIYAFVHHRHCNCHSYRLRILKTEIQDNPRRQAEKPGNGGPSNRPDNARVTYRDGVTSINNPRRSGQSDGAGLYKVEYILRRKPDS